MTTSCRATSLTSEPLQAVTDGMLWAMDRQTFRRIVLRNAFQKRKMYEALLEGVPLLNTLSVSRFCDLDSL